MKTRIIITGATSGIGYATLKALACSKYEIILGVRDLIKAEYTVKTILSLNKEARIYIYHLDLASLESIKKFSEALHRDFESIDILFNNAGVFSETKQKTKQGFEMTIGVNYIGTYFLTMLLKDILEKGNQPQVINVGSRAGLFGKFKYKEDVFKRHAHGFWGYSASKYMLLIATIYLSKQFEDCGIVMNIVHPGTVATNIWKGDSLIMKIIGQIMKKKLILVEEGAIAGLHLIENRPNSSGGFYKMHGEAIEFNKYDEDKAKNLIDRTNDAIIKHGYQF